MKRKAQVALLAGGLITLLGVSGCAGTAGSPVNVSAADNQTAPPLGENVEGAQGDAPVVDDPFAQGAGAPGDAAAEAPGAPEAAAPAAGANKLVRKSIAKMGEVVQDEEGYNLYRFDSDTVNPPTSNCKGECEKAWPPALTNGTPVLEGIEQSLVGTITREDGSKQLTLGNWPLYRFAKDAPGKWAGQGLPLDNPKWWIVAPDGKRNLTCLPKGVKGPGEGLKKEESKESGGDSQGGGGSGGY